VAGFATRGRTVGPHLQHPLLELAFVWIGVATGAVQILPVIDHRRFWLELRRLLVAIRAGNRQVAAG